VGLRDRQALSRNHPFLGNGEDTRRSTYTLTTAAERASTLVVFMGTQQQAGGPAERGDVETRRFLWRSRYDPRLESTVTLYVAP